MTLKLKAARVEGEKWQPVYENLNRVYFPASSHCYSDYEMFTAKIRSRFCLRLQQLSSNKYHHNDECKMWKIFSDFYTELFFTFPLVKGPEPEGTTGVGSGS